MNDKFDYIARRLEVVEVKGEAGNLITALGMSGAKNPKAVLNLIAKRAVQLAAEYDLQSIGFKERK